MLLTVIWNVLVPNPKNALDTLTIFTDELIKIPLAPVAILRHEWLIKIFFTIDPMLSHESRTHYCCR